jgi:hypothetical protein
MFNPKSRLLKDLERSEKGKVRSQEWEEKVRWFHSSSLFAPSLTLVEQQPIRRTELLWLYNL